MTTSRRKPRKDCNYVIYEMVDKNGNNYIGLTRKSETTPLKSVKRRWQKHLSRARKEMLEWTLYQHLRSCSADDKWKHNIIAIVRGRKEAYAAEREIILRLKPRLNDQYMKSKEENNAA
jgi:hypothetical protein